MPRDLKCDMTVQNTDIRVLLVDDEVDLVSQLEKRLRRRGLVVRGVYTGSEALALARGQPFDVAVIDLTMPGMDGLQLLEELKRIQPMVQTIVLTGHGSIENAHRSGQLDARRFLSKPCELDELLAAIHSAYQFKRITQRAAYDRELQEVISSRHSPHEIMAASAHLQKKYEQ